MKSLGAPRASVIIGARGFIGRALANQIRKSGELVVEIQDLDSRSHTGALKALQVNRVVYLRHVPIDSPGKVELNLISLRNAQELSIELGAPFIFVSSGGTVYGEISSPATEIDPLKGLTDYARTKILQEKMLLEQTESDHKLHIFRLTNPYGPSQPAGRNFGFVAELARFFSDPARPLFVAGDGSQVRDFIYLDDVLDAICLPIGDYDHEPVFNLGSGKGHSLNEVIELTNSLMSTELKATYSDELEVGLHYNVVDVRRASKSLGWVPRTTLNEGLLRTIS